MHSIFNHPEAKQFNRAICANPADDLPRLVFADWLDEHPTCNGTGTNGAAERAEFIRLGIEYHYYPKEDCCMCGDNMASHHMGGNEHSFVPMDQTPNELMDRMHKLLTPRYGQWFDLPPKISFTWSRGFVSEVLLTIAQFEEHAGRIAAEHPIEKWVITDREPYTPRGRDSVLLHREDADYGYWWLTRTLQPLPSDLPRNLLAVMSDNWDNVSNTAKGYHTRKAAIEALQLACYKVARQRAEAIWNAETGG